MMTFKKFFETAIGMKRNFAGFTKDFTIPECKFNLHVYEGGKQININICNEETGIMMPAAVFLMKNDIYKAYPVYDDNYVDYANGMSFNEDMPMSAAYPNNIKVNACINWIGDAFGLSNEVYCFNTSGNYKLDPDKKNCLLGKIFHIKISKDNKCLLISPYTRECIWETTGIVGDTARGEIIDGKPHIRYISTENSVYSFITIDMVVEKYQEQNKRITVQQQPVGKSDPEAYALVGQEINYDYKSINYGDGYESYWYSFNKKIDKKKFIEWLSDQHLKTNEKELYPYGDYVKITPIVANTDDMQQKIKRGANGIECKMWEYKLIHQYTD